ESTSRSAGRSSRHQAHRARLVGRHEDRTVPIAPCPVARASSRYVYESAVLREVWISTCRKIEAAGSSFAGSEFRDAHAEASAARVGVLGGVDPAHPSPTCHRRDVLPELG